VGDKFIAPVSECEEGGSAQGYHNGLPHSISGPNGGNFQRDHCQPTYVSLSHPIPLVAQQQGDLVALNEIRLGRLSPTNYQRNQSLILAQAPDEIALDECDRRRFVVAVHFN